MSDPAAGKGGVNFHSTPSSERPSESVGAVREPPEIKNESRVSASAVKRMDRTERAILL